MRLTKNAFVVFCLAAYVLQVAADDCWSTPRKMMSQNVFYSKVCAILAKETSDPFTNIVVRSTDRGNLQPITIPITPIRNTKVESSCRVIVYTTTFRLLIVKFRQLLALCYHYVVSDQVFKKWCDKTVVYKVECTCLHDMVVFEYLRQT